MASKFRVDCPVCGNKLMKAAPCSDVEIDCSKCKDKIRIIVGDAGYQLLMLKGPEATGDRSEKLS